MKIAGNWNQTRIKNQKLEQNYKPNEKYEKGSKPTKTQMWCVGNVVRKDTFKQNVSMIKIRIRNASISERRGRSKKYRSKLCVHE